MLRVFVQGGGCSGLQYGFEFDEQMQDGDTCIENLGVKLLVDPMSVQYLSGAEIDYREGLDDDELAVRMARDHHVEAVAAEVHRRQNVGDGAGTSAATASTWWSRAIRTASSSSSI